MNFYGIFIRDFKFIRGAIIKSNVQNSKKQVKKRKNCKEKGPGPKGNGSWIIQTHQERWIDPAPSNPRSNGQNAGKAEPG
jgi:hypothetical protein